MIEEPLNSYEVSFVILVADRDNKKVDITYKQVKRKISMRRRWELINWMKDNYSKSWINHSL